MKVVRQEISVFMVVAVVLAQLLLHSCSATRRSDSSPPWSRTDFALAFARIDDGMDREEVLRILGRPDEIVTDDRVRFMDKTEVWCYGMESHLDYPSLGRIRFDDKGKVYLLRLLKYSEQESLPSPHLLPEAKLRPLLGLLDEAAGSTPLPVIRAVNLLQALGQEKATATLLEFARVGGPWRIGSFCDEGVFCVVRSLFEVPDPPGFMELPGLGEAHPFPPKDLRHSPRFPFALVEDIPLKIIGGYSLGGIAETFDMHLKKLSKTCRFRTGPLVPTDRPWEVLEKLRASKQWFHGKQYESHYASEIWSPGEFESDEDEIGQVLIIDQILRLVEPVYRPKEGKESWLMDRLKSWPETVETLSRLGIRWDRERLTYTFADGSTLPPEKSPD